MNFCATSALFCWWDYRHAAFCWCSPLTILFFILQHIGCLVPLAIPAAHLWRIAMSHYAICRACQQYTFFCPPLSPCLAPFSKPVPCASNASQNDTTLWYGDLGYIYPSYNIYLIPNSVLRKTWVKKIDGEFWKEALPRTQSGGGGGGARGKGGTQINTKLKWKILWIYVLQSPR